MQFGRLLVIAGGVLMVLGLAAMALNKLNLPLGRLPGDIVWHGKNGVVYFPWVTCLVLSLLGTLAMWLLRRR
jgi:H+/Cl- antiporter ClcA